MPLNRKKRPENQISRLTPSQRDAAFTHCETVSLSEGVLWIKDQFNIRVTARTLSAFLREQRLARSMEPELNRLRDNRDRASLLGQVVNSATSLTVANSVLFSQAIFEEFRKPDDKRDETRLIHFMELALKAREQELKASAIDLSFDRFHFDVAGAALKHASKLQRIHESTASERAKLEKAIKLMFGEKPTDFVVDEPPLEEPAHAAATATNGNGAA